MAYRNKKYFCFLTLFLSSLAASASLHLFLPHALSLWWISPKQIRDAEESCSFLTPLPPFLNSLSLHPPLSFTLTLFLCLIFLSTFFSSLLRMWISFSLIMMIWGSASVAGPLKPSSSESFLFLCCSQTVGSLMRWPLLCILHYKVEFKSGAHIFTVLVVKYNSLEFLHAAAETMAHTHKHAGWPWLMPPLAKVPPLSASSWWHLPLDGEGWWGLCRD